MGHLHSAWSYVAAAPRFWLFVSATLVAMANAALLPNVYDLYDGRMYLITFVIGLQFGQLLVAAVWAAWGPSNWLSNYAIAGGSLLWMPVVSSVRCWGTRDELPLMILFLQSLVGTVLLSVLLLILQNLRYFGRWRWQPQNHNTATVGGQFSLRSILLTTALVAVALGLLKWSTVLDDLDLSMRSIAEFAQATGVLSLVIGASMVAPLTFFLAAIDGRRRLVWVIVAVLIGYVIPFVVVWALARGEIKAVVSGASIVLPVQAGVTIAAALAWAMQHAAGMRFVQRPPTMKCS